MKKRISNVAPLQLGFVLASLYGALSLLFVPFLLLGVLLGAHAPHPQGAPAFAFPAAAGIGLGVVLVILIPIFYGTLGFIGGVISAAIYNLLAMWTGGIEITLTDVAP